MWMDGGDGLQGPAQCHLGSVPILVSPHCFVPANTHAAGIIVTGFCRELPHFRRGGNVQQSSIGKVTQGGGATDNSRHVTWIDIAVDGYEEVESRSITAALGITGMDIVLSLRDHGDGLFLWDFPLAQLGPEVDGNTGFPGRLSHGR